MTPRAQANLGLSAGPLSAQRVWMSAIAVVLPFSGIGSSIGLVELPGVYFVRLGAILVAYGLAGQAVGSCGSSRAGFSADGRAHPLWGSL
jgi:hypothetical protein